MVGAPGPVTVMFACIANSGDPASFDPTADCQPMPLKLHAAPPWHIHGLCGWVDSLFHAIHRKRHSVSLA